MNSLRENFMEPNRNWNSVGPKVPIWFRQALERLDRRLVLQFMPPDYFDEKGVSSGQYPFGVWIIARRMPRTGWLLISKQWTFSLSDLAGRYKIPDHGDLKLLRVAKNMWKRGNLCKLDEVFDNQIKRIRKERCEDSRRRLVRELENGMRRRNMGEWGHSKIAVPVGFENDSIVH